MATGIHHEVRRMIEAGGDHGRISRNQNPALFSGSRGKRLMRLYRLYRALILEVAAAADRPGARVWASERGGGLLVGVEDPARAYSRRTTVPPELADLFRRKLGELGLETQ